MRYENIKEATTAWQNQFNTFPLGMIQKLFNADVDDWHEITPIAEGCRVWSNEYQDGAEVIKITENEDEEKVIKICLDDNGEEVIVEFNDLSREEDTYFSMWGWMWSFDDSTDDWWLENNLETMGIFSIGKMAMVSMSRFVAEDSK